jgi:hypothetical protein
LFLSGSVDELLPLLDVGWLQLVEVPVEPVARARADACNIIHKNIFPTQHLVFMLFLFSITYYASSVIVTTALHR